MPATITSQLKSTVIETFREGFANSATDKYYIVVSRHMPWTSDSSPETPNTSLKYASDLWNSAIFAKRIYPFEVSLVVPRKDWATGKKYPYYDDNKSDTLLFPSNNNSNVTSFPSSNDTPYVLSGSRVYLCLDNGRGGNGNVSTVQPTNEDALASYESDGYLWKYLFKLDSRGNNEFKTTQWMPISFTDTVEGTANTGAIYTCVIDTAGSGYPANTTLAITFTGDGTGATANAYSNAGGYINSVVMTNFGQSYSYASANLTSGYASGSGVVLRPIISSPKGYGVDRSDDLGCSALMISATVYNNETGAIIDSNDFRQIALVKNPYVYGTTNVANSGIYNLTTVVGVLDATGASYQADEIVYQGTNLATATFWANVAYWNVTESKIYLTNPRGTLDTSQLKGSTSGTTKYVDVSGVVQPGLEPNSGKTLFISNITPVTRSSSQNENFKIVLRV